MGKNCIYKYGIWIGICLSLLPAISRFADAVSGQVSANEQQTLVLTISSAQDDLGCRRKRQQLFHCSHRCSLRPMIATSNISQISRTVGQIGQDHVAYYYFSLPTPCLQVHFHWTNFIKSWFAFSSSIVCGSSPIITSKL